VLPSLTIPRLVNLVAHEAYPGHHTEYATKEWQLTCLAGWREHSMILLESPSCVVSEGIAMRALRTVMSEVEMADWCEWELYPLAGLSAAHVKREIALENARMHLRAVVGNAAMLLEEDCVPSREVVTYIRHYGCMDEAEAAQMLRFIKAARGHVFTYRTGSELLEALSKRGEQGEDWQRRLLNEPVVPSRVRSWAAGQE